MELAEPGDPEPADVVVVGATDSYSTAQINAASLAVDAGAPLYTTVDVPWFHGGIGKSVRISAAVANAIGWATGATPQVLGKPSPALGETLLRRLDVPAAEVTVVGDATVEIQLARHMGANSALVLSGATSAEELATLTGDGPAGPGRRRRRRTVPTARPLPFTDARSPTMSTEHADRFPFFHEAKAPAGAEGWESMYPYYLVPSEETQAHEDAAVLVRRHHALVPRLPPLRQHRRRGRLPGRGHLQHPHLRPAGLAGPGRARGRTATSISPRWRVTDPERIQERAAVFQKRAGYYYANWDELYGKWKTKMEGAIDSLQSISFPTLAEYDPDQVVDEARGRSDAMAVIENYHRLIDEFFAIWQYHFEFLNLGYGGYITFFQFCKQAFPLITDQSISRMVAGVDVLAFRPDDELRKLAQLANDLDLVDDGHRRRHDGRACWPRSRPPRTGGPGSPPSTRPATPGSTTSPSTASPTTRKPGTPTSSIPLGSIARYARKIAAGEDISRPIERLRAERDEIVDEYRALLTADEAEQFDELLDLARTVFPYIEEHNIYVEHWSHNVFWQKCHELADAAWSTPASSPRPTTCSTSTASSWTRCSPTSCSRGRSVFRPAASSAGRPRSSGASPSWRPCRRPLRRRPTASRRSEVTDPFAVMNYGVTTERVNDWLGASDGESNTLNGIPGSLGVVEGPVRVLRSEKDLPRPAAGRDPRRARSPRRPGRPRLPWPPASSRTSAA